MTGVELIAAERKRQIEKEGWTQEHDKLSHAKGDLALAGLCYAMDTVSHLQCIRHEGYGLIAYNLWPWHRKWWKPTPDDHIRQLVKAGALIAAEIDKLQNEG